MENSEHWLIFSHCYNMDGRAASQLVKPRISELSRRGVKCTVISAPNGAHDPYAFKHKRVFSLFPAGLKFELRHWIRREVQPKTLQRILLFVNSIVLSPLAIIERIFIPLESQWSWFFSAFASGTSSISTQRNSIDLVYSTGGPVGGHFAGILLSKIFRIPCVCEFQDPLFFDSLEWRPKGRSKFLYRMVEKYILKNSYSTVFMSKTAMSRAVLRTKINPKNAHFIYSGAPSVVQCPRSKSTNVSSRMILSHFGTLADRRNLNALFESLQQVIHEHPHAEEFLKIELYGFLDLMVERSISSFEFKSIISIKGTIPHERALEKMEQSDILLLIQDDSYVAEETIPSKIYEYLQKNKPVLALVNNKELYNILLEFNCYSAMIRDQEMIGIEILNILNDAKMRTLKYPSGDFPDLNLAIDKLLQIKVGLTRTQIQ
jgi:hypothetical protein